MSSATEQQSKNNPEPDSYDELNYPSFSFGLTHIGRLAAIGHLFGIEAGDPTKARVLEVGCGTGINTLAMAQLFPDAQFIGLDLSKSQIEMAEKAKKEVGLENVQFLHADINDLSDDLGTFDYIISHGVYSWIPDASKQALLRINKKHLAPNGIAYISYNCLPGWKMRGALRDMMLMHTRGYSTAAEKVTQAKALLEFLSKASNNESPYGKFLSQELKLLLGCEDSYIAHEFLENDNDAFYFMDFQRQASEAGLFYLGDAQPATMMMVDIPEEAQKVFAQLKGNLAATEQYLDFLRNRTFRCTLLCHPGLPIDRDIKSFRVNGLTVVSQVILKQAHADGKPALFKAEGEVEIAIKDQMTAKVFEAVAMRSVISVNDLVDALLEPIRALNPDSTDAQIRDLIGHTLLRGLFSKLLDLYVAEHALVEAPAGKPAALPLARWQAARGLRISSKYLWMTPLDNVTQKFMQRCDGTRTEPELKEWIVEANKTGQIIFNVDEKPITDPDKIESLINRFYTIALERLSRQGLLLPTS